MSTDEALEALEGREYQRALSLLKRELAVVSEGELHALDARLRTFQKDYRRMVGSTPAQFRQLIDGQCGLRVTKLLRHIVRDRRHLIVGSADDRSPSIGTALKLRSERVGMDDF